MSTRRGVQRTIALTSIVLIVAFVVGILIHVGEQLAAASLTVAVMGAIMTACTSIHAWWAKRNHATPGELAMLRLCAVANGVLMAGFLAVGLFALF